MDYGLRTGYKTQTSCMHFRMIQAMIKCFERSTVERIEENRPFAAKPSHDLLFIKLWAIT